MNIQDKYEKLILQYNISDVIPEYEKYICAKHIFNDFYCYLLLKGNNIIFVASNMTDILWFSRKYKIPVKQFLMIEDDDVEKYKIQKDVVYIVVSYARQYEISSILIRKNVDPIRLYDVFDMKGLHFSGTFFDIYHTNMNDFKTKKMSYDFKDFDINKIFFFHRRIYESSTDQEVKLLYLRFMIFDCAYAYDFITLKKCLELLSNFDQVDKNRYIEFYTAIEDLLGNIKYMLDKRSHNDVIMFWLDALEYGEDRSVDFLKSLDKTAIVFENMYTVTPFTSTTFKTLLTGKTAVDGENYKIEKIGDYNSNLIQMLNKNGYQFKYYGNLQIPENDICADNLYSIYTPISVLIWDSIVNILETDQPLFCMLHEVLHTHNPFISFDVIGEEYVYCEERPGLQTENEQLLAKNQVMPSRKYVDKQLSFWNNLVPKKMFKIYMSDHGHTTFGKFHSIFKVQQRDLYPMHVNNLLSYAEFSWLIDCIIKKDIKQIIKKENSFVMVQDIPFYNKMVILSAIEDIETFETTPFAGYQGIITKEDTYLKYNDGVEMYVKNVMDGIPFSQKRMIELRGHLSNQYVDVYKEPKFKYCKYIYNAIKNRDEKRMQGIVNEIIFLFEGFEGKRVALRGGGIHTLRLLMILPDRIVKKISYILDQNTECLGGKLGIPVCSLNEICREEIDIIVISSYDFDKEWKEELSHYVDVQCIISLYDYLDQKGYECKKEFYRYSYKKEDFGEVECEQH